MFHWKFIIYLQIKDTFHLIATEKAKTHPLWKPIYNLFTEINAPHLIGKKAAIFHPYDERFTFCLQNLAPSTYIARKIDLLITGFQKIYPLTYIQKIGVLRGCFGRCFTVSLQKQKSPHLIGQKSGKISPSRWKVYILFTKINTPHLIGQKIAVLKGAPLKIYNLFTDQGHSLLNSHGNCKK